MPATILVVEDEAIIAMGLRDRLRALGYTVGATVSSGQEAVDRALEIRPDLILMDIRIRGDTDGIEAASEIHEHLDVPVIFLTAYADDETLQRARVTEPYGYILKPFEERELHTNIEIALYKHKSERELKRSQEWLSTTLRSIGDAVVTTDGQGMVTSVNPAALMMTGWSLEDAIGSPVRQILELFAPPDSDDSYHQRIPDPMESAFASVLKDATLTTRDGREVPVDYTVAPIRSDSNAGMGAVYVLRDMSERRRLEEQLVHAQRMDAIGRLAGGIAHDFNNILVTIKGFSTFARRGLPPESSAHSDIMEVQRAADRAADLVKQLLSFSRKRVSQPRNVDINDVIMDADQMLRHLIGASIELSTLPAPGLGTVRVDPSHIEQVILNLVVNARDAMPEGGAITIETSNTALDETRTRAHPNARPGTYVLLSVTDTGTGMSEAVKSRIFEPFFTTKEVGKGTGLGLSVVYGVVTRAKGIIECDSAIGEGSVFRVYFPSSPRQADALPPRDENGYLPGGRETILIVEDNPSVRRFCARSLQEMGYVVLEAENGVSALALADENRSDPIRLVVTDMVMPHMSGRQVQRELAAKLPGIKALLMSGYSENAPTESEVDPDVGFLQKPFTDALLARTVRELLDR